MKESKNWGRVIENALVVTVASTVMLLSWRGTKKKVEKIKKVEEDVTTKLEKAGIKRKVLEEMPEPVKTDFMKSLFAAATIHKTLSQFSDIDQALESDMVIHVTSHEQGNLKFMDLIYQVPNWTLEDTKGLRFASQATGLKIQDYISSLKNFIEGKKRSTRDLPVKYHTLSAYVVFNLIVNQETEEYVSVVREVNSNVFQKLESIVDQEHPESSFVENFWELSSKKESAKKTFMLKILFDELIAAELKDKNINPEDITIQIPTVFVGWKVVMPLQDYPGKPCITLDAGINLLVDSVNELTIKGRYTSETAVFDSIMFHCPTTDNGNYELTGYRSVGNGSIVEDSFQYDITEKVVNGKKFLINVVDPSAEVSTN